MQLLIDIQERLVIHEQFLALFTANEPAIRAYVRRLVATRQDAADVMQGIALVLWLRMLEVQLRENAELRRDFIE